MTKFIPTQELDFLAYRESLKEYLKSQETFKDYDYEGSNIAILLDILSLNTMQNAYYENMIGSEMFMDTALLKNSVVSRAKELNYTPRSRSAARTSLSISFNTGNSSPTSITIPKYYVVQSHGVDAKNASKVYNFVVNTAVIVQPDSFGNFTAQDVMAYQGTVVSEIFPNDGGRFVLQSNTIDINSIEVTVQNSASDNTVHVWERTKELYGINGTANIFFVQAYHDDRYELVFGNDVIGRALAQNNLVLVKYISTNGEECNGLNVFQGSTAVEGYTVSSIISDGVAYGGGERESIDSVKYQAPRYFTTQERAVTESDFENMVRINFTDIQSAVAYGGERLSPPQYGSVAISLKPFGSKGNVSDKIKNQIIQFLKTKSMTTPVIIDPDYFYIKINTTVYYDSDNINISLNQMKTNVTDAIYEFGQTTLNDFNSDFRYSKLISVIDGVDTNIVSNDTELSLLKRYVPIVKSSEDIKIDFGMPLKKFTLTQPFAAGQAATLISTIFSYTVNGVNYYGYLEDDGMGVLRIVSNSASKNVILANAGSINYDTGEVTLKKDLKISSFGGGYIGIEVKSRDKDLVVDVNRFLLVDTGDIIVNIKKAAQ